MMYPHGIIGVEPSQYPSKVVSENLYREDAWRASHLRTFKHSLWDKINEDDLKDDNGSFYTVAYDQAIMLPLLEMAGAKAVYLPDILHIYNKENPLNVDKIKTEQQKNTALEIRRKPKYERVV